MITYLIQPPYGLDSANAEEFFKFKLQKLEEIPSDADIVVLPEYSDTPISPRNKEQAVFYHEKYCGILLEKCRETAKRCSCLVFFNTLDEMKNTTVCLDKNGEIIGKYRKTHIPPAEKKLGVEYKYTEEIYDNYVLDYEGIRYAFLTCYDFYFYESFPKIARLHPDIIIGAALQRSDTPYISETICRFLAYNTSAYVLRASVSMGEGSKTCGGSMIVDTEGRVINKFDNEIGILRGEFDPKLKFKKPGGFGNPDCLHFEYIEKGRRPWQYRQCGSSVVLCDAEMPYPRICAHRGFNTIAPENSLASFGAAVGMGADEIEFDVWSTADGVLVCTHDEELPDGSGKVWEKSYAELKNIDFSGKFGERFSPMQIPTFEQILKKFSCRVIMNIHIKIWDKKQSRDYLEQIVALVRKYDCEKHCYFMSVNGEKLKKCRSYAPEIRLCVGDDENNRHNLVGMAMEIGAEKVQFSRRFVTEGQVKQAHDNNIRCNVYFADDEKTIGEIISLGADCILSDDYSNADKFIKKFRQNMC